jgi:thiamine pyrophosphate-dependent acetolactate synthase large subunit-like protein
VWISSGRRDVRLWVKASICIERIHVKVHQVLALALSRLGVDTVFGVMGDANLFMVDSFVRDFGGAFVPATHEANAVVMAKSYAELTGRLGVATVTHGPGLTNTATAVVECVRAGTSVLLIAGDTAQDDTGNIQRMEQREFVRSLGAGWEPSVSSDRTYESLLRAATRAVTESGPVVLDVSAGFMWDDVATPAEGRLGTGRREASPNPDDLDDALGVVLSSARPIILAGFGARSGPAREAIVSLSDAIGAPLATTLKAKDLFHEHPRNIGIFGTLASDAGSQYIAASDCILAFGASLNRWTTANGDLLSGKKLVQVDWNAAALAQHMPVTAGITGGAAVTASRMRDWVSDSGVKASGFGETVARASATSLKVVPELDQSPDDSVSLSAVITAIEPALEADRILVADLGRAVFEALSCLPTPSPGALVWTASFGSIGLGMSGAVGAHYARPGSPIVLVTGDGGFMMGGLAELSTAVRAQMDLIVVLANDGSYGAEHVQFRDRGMDPGLTLSVWPDFAEVARSMGAQAVTISGASDLAAAHRAVAERSKVAPLLVEVRLDPDKARRVGH